MSAAIKPPAKLEDGKLWRLASQIAKEAYTRLEEFPEEEKWGMESKLRMHAFNLTSDMAEVEGCIDPRGRHYELSLTRRSLFAIKNVYKMAHDTAVAPLRPESMVSIDELVKLIDEKLLETPKAIRQWDDLLDPQKEVKKL